MGSWKRPRGFCCVDACCRCCWWCLPSLPCGLLRGSVRPVVFPLSSSLCALATRLGSFTGFLKMLPPTAAVYRGGGDGGGGGGGDVPRSKQMLYLVSPVFYLHVFARIWVWAKTRHVGLVGLTCTLFSVCKGGAGRHSAAREGLSDAGNLDRARHPPGAGARQAAKSVSLLTAVSTRSRFSPFVGTHTRLQRLLLGVVFALGFSAVFFFFFFRFALPPLFEALLPSRAYFGLEPPPSV